MGCGISKADGRGASALIRLNDDLNREILKRSPIDSLLRFRLVSKYWHRLISDYLLLGRTSMFLHIKLSDDPSHQFGFLRVHNFFLPPMDTLITPHNLPSLPTRKDYWLISETHNLLLYYLLLPGHFSSTYIVYNPATAQSITLPPAFDRGTHLAADADWDPHTGHLIAARFVKGGSPGSLGPTSSVLELYSSRTNIWREFGTALGAVDPENKSRYGEGGTQVFRILFNGDSLFVLVARCASYLVRFDIRTENFQQLEFPTPHISFGTVGKCNGDIVYGWSYQLHFRLWKLEAQEQRLRWIPIHKQSCISLRKQLRERALVDTHVMISSFFVDSEIMLFYTNNSVFSYELDTGRLKCVLKLDDGHRTIYVVPFSLSPRYIPMADKKSAFASPKRSFFPPKCR